MKIRIHRKIRKYHVLSYLYRVEYNRSEIFRVMVDNLTTVNVEIVYLRISFFANLRKWVILR